VVGLGKRERKKRERGVHTDEKAFWFFGSSTCSNNQFERECPVSGEGGGKSKCVEKVVSPLGFSVGFSVGSVCSHCCCWIRVSISAFTCTQRTTNSIRIEYIGVGGCVQSLFG